ncbi:hypothetical protein K474DRAFT_1582276, partial [Panus rudis PR-1116 ss-1]
KVCVKQLYTRMTPGGPIRRLEHTEETKKMCLEALCHIWSRTLLDLAYSEIETRSPTSGETANVIPRLRFVEAAIAVVHSPSSVARKVLLIEELIDVGAGEFTKYINNALARPIEGLDADSHRLAEFLCCVQHIQYEATQGLVYLSDFQGGNHLLTDSQVITSPALPMDIFSSGNVGFEQFVHQHICNQFCKAYGL